MGNGNVNAAVCSVKIVDSALTAEQLYTEYESTWIVGGGAGSTIEAVSGTFSQSLTVSGIPVATGTGLFGTMTFYTAPTSGASTTVLNTVVIDSGLIESWDQV
jgi:hypothetical protein